MNIIFYFSGTGNSIHIAKLLAQKLKDTKVASIQNINDYPVNSYKKIGFIFPVYYLHAPNFVINTLRKLELVPLQHVFLVAAFAGSWGFSLEDAHLAILEKNKHLIAKDKILLQQFKVRVPGNYILEYGASSSSLQNYILQKAEIKLDKIALTILQESSVKIIKANLIAKIYKHKGIEKPKEFSAIGKQFFTNSNCNLCGMCIKLCPVKNIDLKENRIQWDNRCQQCMTCVQWCPRNAVAHPLLKADRKKYTNPFIKIGEMQVSNYE